MPLCYGKWNTTTYLNQNTRTTSWPSKREEKPCWQFHKQNQLPLLHKTTTAYPNPMHILTGLKLFHGFIHILELDLKRSLLHKNLRLWLPRTSGSFLGQKQIFLPKFRNLFSISYGTSNLLYQIISENVQAIQIRLLKEYGY